MASQAPAAAAARFQPTVLAVSGLAAVIGSYLIYRSIFADHDSSPPIGALRRRNAIHHRDTTANNNVDPVVSIIQETHSLWPICFVTHGDHTFTYDLIDGAPTEQEVSSALPITGDFLAGFMRDIQTLCLLHIFQVIVTQPPSDLPDGFLDIRQTLADRDPEAMRGISTVFTQGRWRFSEDSYGHATANWDTQPFSELQLPVLPDPSIQDTDTIASSPNDDPATRNQNNLHQLLYTIAEDEALSKAYVHRGTRCDSCNALPIVGIRWHCINCPDYDLCSACESRSNHVRTHLFVKIKVPVCTLNQPRTIQRSWYPGKHPRDPPPLDTAERVRLVTTYDLEEGIIAAYYDQFICLSAPVHTQGGLYTIGIDLDNFRKAFTSDTSDHPVAPSYLLDRMFSFYNTSKSGWISFEEFVSGLSYLADPKRRQVLARVFQGYDADGDRFVSRADMVRMLREKYKVHQTILWDAVNVEDEQPRYAAQDHHLPPMDLSEHLRGNQPISAYFRFHAFGPGNARRTYTKPTDRFGDPQTLAHDVYRRPILPDGETEMDTGFWRAVFQRYRRPGALSDLHPDFNHRLDARQEIRRRYIGAESYPLESRNGSASMSLARADNRESRPLTFDTQELARDWSEDIAGYSRDGAPEVTPASSQQLDVTGNDKTYPVPEDGLYLGEDVLYQVTEDAWNELLDPLFREKENLAEAVRHSKVDRDRYRKEIDAFVKGKKKREEETLRKKSQLVPNEDGEQSMGKDDGAQHEHDVRDGSRHHRSASLSPEADRNARPTAPHLSQADVMTEIQRDAVPTDEASLSAMETQIQNQDLETLLQSSGFSVDGNADSRSLDAHPVPPAVNGSITTASVDASEGIADAAEDGHGSENASDSLGRGEDGQGDLVLPEHPLPTAAGENGQGDRMDVDDEGKEPLQELRWTAEAVEAVASPPLHQSGSNAEEAGIGPTQGSHSSPEATNLPSPSAPHEPAKSLPPAMGEEQTPTLEQLRVWAHHDEVEAEMKERGGPARINLYEFNKAVVEDEMSNHYAPLRALVSSWLEWAGF